MSDDARTETAPRSEGRRAFLMTAGKVALAAPPVMTAVLAAGSRPAHATLNYTGTKKRKKFKKKFFRNGRNNVGVV